MIGTRAFRASLLAGVVGLALALAASAGAGRSRQAQAAKIDPHVAAGAHDFVNFACSACHGERGRGGVSKYVPALTQVAPHLTLPLLTAIVQHGLGVVNNPKRPYMPVWGPVISTTQIGDLYAYLKAGLPAVQYATPVPVPRDQGAPVAGAALYVRYGCINCHGPNGLGGVPNPSAPDKAIPPLAGQDFRKQFNTDKKIVDFIDSGSVIGHAPIVSMPHWGGIIPSADLNSIVAYLKTLK